MVTKIDELMLSELTRIIAGLKPYLHAGAAELYGELGDLRNQLMEDLNDRKRNEVPVIAIYTKTIKGRDSVSTVKKATNGTLRVNEQPFASYGLDEEISSIEVFYQPRK